MREPVREEADLFHAGVARIDHREVAHFDPLGIVDVFQRKQIPQFLEMTAGEPAQARA